MSAFGSGSGSGSTNPVTCDLYKENLTAGLDPFQILNFVTPHDDRVWTERGDAWMVTMKVYVGVVALIYFLLGLLSFTLIFKKDCIRLPTKTFFTVYMILTILGFSRALHLILDPYSLFGFIGNKFEGWIIISRLFASAGFPSLVANCTLIIFTLLKITKARIGKQWYHSWKNIIPIAVTPYIIAVSAELISYVIPYPALISIILCEAFFVLWGISICIAYLFAGIRLLRKLQSRQRRTMRISASVTNTEDNTQSSAVQSRKDFAAQEYERHYKRTRKTARKITIITYGSAVMGVIYSLVTGAGLIMVCLLVFHDCLGFDNKRGNSSLWLALQFAARTTEILLSLVIFYSITDVTGVAKFMKQILLCSCCKKNRQVMQQCTGRYSTSLASLHTNKTSDMCILTNVKRTETVNVDDPTSRADMEDSNRTQNSEVEAPEISIEVTLEEIERNDTESGVSTHNPRAFMLVAQNDSASSIDTGSIQPSCTSPARSVSGEPHAAKLISVSTGTSGGDQHHNNNSDVPERETATVAQSTATQAQNTVVDTATEPPSAEVERSDHSIAGAAETSSVATQTVKQRTIACQTEPPPQKPVPKPRRFLPGKSPRQTRRQRMREQQKQLKGPQKSLFRKQTV